MLDCGWSGNHTVLVILIILAMLLTRVINSSERRGGTSRKIVVALKGIPIKVNLLLLQLAFLWSSMLVLNTSILLLAPVSSAILAQPIVVLAVLVELMTLAIL